MILTTTETISGRNLATLGLVQGNTIQSKHMFSDMGPVSYTHLTLPTIA